MDGDLAVLGAPYDDEAGDASGSASVFRWNGTRWTEEAKLLAAEPRAEDLFGYSVAVDGDVVVVGTLPFDAPGGYGFGGSATVFRWDGSAWVREATLHGNSERPGSQAMPSEAIFTPANRRSA